MNTNSSDKAHGGAGSPGERDSDSDNDDEVYDTLSPLPNDVLNNAVEFNDLGTEEGPAPSHHDYYDQQCPESSGADPFSPVAAPTTAASRRRSVEASSGRPIFPVHNPTKQDLTHARKILEALQTKHGFVTPDRGNLDDPSILWKEGKPDYTIADMVYMLGKTKNHAPGSLEETVENFVKTWEMEATHKEFYQWTTVDQSSYEVQANGGKVYSSYEAPWVGNYNWLLSTCDKELYDSTNETFESSHGKFRYAFPEGFPFEVLEVFSGPPKITFTWRHWAIFSGEFEGHKGNGETINMTGFGVAYMNDKLKAKKIEIYMDSNSFLQVLRGKKKCMEGINQGMAVGEPIAGGVESLASMMEVLALEEKEIESLGDAGDGMIREESTLGENGTGKSSGFCPFSGMSLS
mmetsp:Transcript_19167/g.40406  ORF Transcript_19167/g.40406 Transcript_19167/m.40406 type:complete len:405 (+) Transcript_19167:157-1371(+)